MKNYLITIFNSPEAEKTWENLTPEQMQASLSKYMAYSERLRNEGRLLAGEGLSMNGHTIRGTGADQHVTDGPHILAKELVGGFYFITAENLDEALAIARDCPGLGHGATVEVREQMDYGQ